MNGGDPEEIHGTWPGLFMRECDEDEEKSLQRRGSQGFARKAYPMRYVDRANPRTPSLKRI
jgi:hypothetical protein